MEGRSPIEDAADIASDRITDAFSLLGNETRLAILLALWEAFEPFPDGTWDPTEGNAVTFSDLRERVGLRDSGQFNYHLGKLEGHFIEQSPEGYQLLPAGQDLVRTVIAGAGFDEPATDRTGLDIDCQFCGAATAVTYQNQRIYHVCTACEGAFELGEKHPPSVLSAWIVKPNVLRGRSTDEIYAAVNTATFYEFALRSCGVCPHCSGRVDSTLDTCDAHHPSDDEPCPECHRQALAVIRHVCTGCKHSSVSSVNYRCYTHPATVAFAWDHDIELGHRSWDTDVAKWVLAVDADHELVSADPPVVRVTFRYEDDEVQLTVNEHLEVIAVVA